MFQVEPALIAERPRKTVIRDKNYFDGESSKTDCARPGSGCSARPARVKPKGQDRCCSKY